MSHRVHCGTRHIRLGSVPRAVWMFASFDLSMVVSYASALPFGWKS